MSELTGRRRFRRVSSIANGEYLILQVEVTEFVHGLPSKDDLGLWRCYWRDATHADVTGETVV
jgi:hypothetical protein